jgi:hypothetical protein
MKHRNPVLVLALAILFLLGGGALTPNQAGMLIFQKVASPEPAPQPPPVPGQDNPELPPAPISKTTQISQYGITWTFAEPVQYGQFVNGDYWVVDPGGGVKITRITPGHMVVNGTDRNGSMLNPRPTSGHGYDGRASGYSSTLNVARGLSSLRMSAGDVLISTISLDTGIYKSYVKGASILTVVSSAPQSGSFRPGYCDTQRVIYNKNNLNYSLLKKLTPTASTPTLSSVERMFQRPWVMHITNWAGNKIHPVDNMSDYGTDIAQDVSVGSLMLHLNFSDAQKEKLMIYFVQLGIDAYGIIKNSSGWAPDGGHSGGRKWPIIFAGMVLNDPAMKNIGKVSGDYLYSGSYGPGNPPPGYKHFGEDGQTFYVSQFDVNITNSSNWNPDGRNGTPYRYTSQMIGMPEWAIRHSTIPSKSDSAWYAIYRQCCTARVWTGFVLAAHMMDAKPHWNNNALFDYQDRYMAISKGDRDPFGFTVQGQAQGWRTSGFVSQMWDKYRANY